MLLIKNGIIHLPENHVERGWDILTDNEKIAAIGPNLNAPNAQIIIADDLDVYPGFVLPLSAVGAMGYADGYDSRDKDESSDPLTPQVNIRYSFDLRELKLQHFARAGITSYGLSPGLTNLLAGQMAFIHVDGCRTEDVFIREAVALKGNYNHYVKDAFGNRCAPMTHMAMYQMLDESFRCAKSYLEKDESKPFDAKLEVLSRVLRREIPFLVNAYTQNEIESMVWLGRKYDIDLVLCGAFAIDKCAEQVIEQGWHVVLGDPSYFMDGLRTDVDLSSILAWYRRGLKLSLGCSGDVGYPPGYEQLLWVAAMLRRAGASGDELIDMMTLNPATALGVSEQVGSLQVGKLADIILCHGNPAVRFDNYVDRTIVAGRQIYVREV